MELEGCNSLKMIVVHLVGVIFVHVYTIEGRKHGFRAQDQPLGNALIRRGSYLYCVMLYFVMIEACGGQLQIDISDEQQYSLKDDRAGTLLAIVQIFTGYGLANDQVIAKLHHLRCIQYLGYIYKIDEISKAPPQEFGVLTFCWTPWIILLRHLHTNCVFKCKKVKSSKHTFVRAQFGQI